MGRGRFFLGRLMDEADLDALPGHPVVELAGDSRVLIENHFGVTEYGMDRITVAMGYGQVSILGEAGNPSDDQEQLVICGRITGLELKRRRSHDWNDHWQNSG